MVKKKAHNVNVVIRIRPEMPYESVKSKSLRIQSTERDVIIKQIEKRVSVNSVSKKFNFDRVYDEMASQKDIFNLTVSSMISEVISGFNCTIFAYGQTGTGKTYTIEGDVDYRSISRQFSDNQSKSLYLSNKAGIIPRAVKSIFERLAQLKTEFSVRISLLELYNEELIDLLTDDDEKPLRIYEDANGGISVHNLQQIIARNEEDIFNILRKGVEKRHTAETKINRQSSRSHCVFTLTVHMKEGNSEGEDIVKIGILNLVDLAGSECVGRSGAKNERAKEAGMINTSLLTLGRVVTALVDHLPYVPYRDSKLTRLLQESLGGRAKTVIIATISPFADEETISTLEYANRAKNVLNKPEVNQKLTHGKYLKEVTCKLLELQKENECLRKEHGIYLPEEKYNRMVCESRSLAEKAARSRDTLNMKIKENDVLNESLTKKRNAINALRAEKEEMKQNLENSEKMLEKTQKMLSFCSKKVDEKDGLLKAYRENEITLFNAAESLKMFSGELSGANSALFDKIDAKNRIEDSNIKNAKDLNAFMLSSTNLLEECRNRFSIDEKQSEQQIQSVLDRFTTETDAAVQKINVQLEKLRGVELDKQKECAERVKECEMEHKSKARRFKSECDEFYGELLGPGARGIANKSNFVKARVESVQTEINNFTIFIKTHLEENSKELKTRQKTAASFWQNQTTILANIINASENFNARYGKSSTEIKNFAGKVFANANAKTLAAVEKIIESVRAMSEEIAKDRENDFQKCADEFNSKLAFIEAETQNWSNLAKTEMQNCIKNQTEYSETQNENFKETETKNSDLVIKIEKMESESKNSQSAFYGDLDATLGDVVKLLLNQKLSSEEFLKCCQNSTHEICTELLKELAEISKLPQFSNVIKDLKIGEKIRKLTKIGQKLTKTRQSRCESDFEKVALIGENVKRRLAQFFSNEIAKYVSTGKTPKRKPSAERSAEIAQTLKRTDEDKALRALSPLRCESALDFEKCLAVPQSGVEKENRLWGDNRRSFGEKLPDRGKKHSAEIIDIGKPLRKRYRKSLPTTINRINHAL